ncbi:hypothetical protein JCM3770_000438 [Rhodotorula araucariae]
MNQSIPLATDALAHPPADLAGNPLLAEAQATLPPHIRNSSAPAGAAVGLQSNAEGTGLDAKLQVVDENQRFTSALNAHMKGWQLADAGFNYDVVAVFGSQSTGKSTLLNRLFGTKFDVMSETERRQTTKGIWMSKGQDMPVLVMDVEGTDGRERGEDQDFERKSALFSMAVAEVLLVNIWEHQVGLYQGANMGLLKTVFEVNLGLFLSAKQKGKAKGDSQDKTLLLFVIRDHIGATPLANLRATLTADLNRLWDGLSKPEGLESTTIDTFFDLDFVTLPHKLLQPELFEQQVVALRKRFSSTKEGGDASVFKSKYHKRIPADGISTYMGTIWDAVVSNKDLDLPTQQELLAQFRCGELAAAAFAAFSALVAAFPPAPAAGQPLDTALGARMGEAKRAALEAYDAPAARYHPAVYARQRAELVGKVHAALAPVFATQLKSAHKLVLRAYRVEIEAALRNEAGYDFARVVGAARQAAERAFDDEVARVLLEESGWSADEERAALGEDLDAVAELLRKEETRKMVAVIERNIKRQMAETVEVALNHPSEDMWDKVLGAFKAALAKAEEAYIRKATSFNCTEEEMQAALSLLRRRAWLALRSKLDEHTADAPMLVKLKLVFEEKFRYDADGVPRVWKPEDDIDAVFRKARDSVLELIPLYAEIRPADSANVFELPSSSGTSGLVDPAAAAADDEFDFAESLQLLSPSAQAALATRFRREADAYYLEAKRSMVATSSQIPYWIYGVLVLLGWNEFIAVVRSPIYFTVLLLLGAAAYVTYTLNMTGPVLALARGVSNEVVRTVNEQLHNHFAGQTHAQRHAVPVAAANSSAQAGQDIELSEKRAGKGDKDE